MDHYPNLCRQRLLLLAASTYQTLCVFQQKLFCRFSCAFRSLALRTCGHSHSTQPSGQLPRILAVVHAELDSASRGLHVVLAPLWAASTSNYSRIHCAVVAAGMMEVSLAAFLRVGSVCTEFALVVVSGLGCCQLYLNFQRGCSHFRSRSRHWSLRGQGVC